jgi:hypothetical protein
MKQQLKAKFPQWVNESQYGKFNLCMSDDMDSFFSCSLLYKLFGYDIKYYYDFKSIYTAPHIHKPTVCVDIAVEKGMTWDNHVVNISPSDIANPLSANINAINGINRDTYYKKYAGSTLLQIISYYNIPIPKNTEARLILLAIDSSFMGHYSKNFKDIHRRHMEQLELYELIDELDRQTSMQAYYDVRNKYRLNDKIRVNENGKLETTINLAALQGLFDVDLKLPEESFTKSFEFANYGRHTVSQDMEKPPVYSFALTSKNEFKYTMNGDYVKNQ